MLTKLEEDVWEKGHPGIDENHKLDDCGAVMYKNSRDNSDLAWEIDHIFPKAVLEFFNIEKDLIDDIRNLRPLHHANNASKGNEFPVHAYVRKSQDGKTNEVVYKITKIDALVILSLRKLYEPELGMTLEKAIEKYYKSKH